MSRARIELWTFDQPTAGFCRLLALVLISTILGCGPNQPDDPNRSTISGAVTLNGKPLPAGTITFKAAEGYIATTVSINEGGRYSTTRAPIGANGVSIDTESLRFGYPAGYVPIPAKYADPSTSGFKVDVKAGENENVNFELKK